MELTYEEAQQMLERRLAADPVRAKLVAEPAFTDAIAKIALYEHVNAEMAPLIAHEVKLVLASYAPLSTLSENIKNVTGVETAQADGIATLISGLLFEGIRDELYAFDAVWQTQAAQEASIPEANNDLKEKLELRPEQATGSGPRPLTRDEVLRSIAPSRTMGSDIASLKGQGTAVPPTTKTPTPPPAA